MPTFKSNPTLNTYLAFLLIWILAAGFAFLGVMPAVAHLVRETLALPPVMADMFTGLAVGVMLGSGQALALHFVRRPIARWLWRSTLGGVAGGLLGGMLAIWGQAMSTYTVDHGLPVAAFAIMIGLAQWSLIRSMVRYHALWLVSYIALGVWLGAGVALPGLIGLFVLQALLGLMLSGQMRRLTLYHADISELQSEQRHQKAFERLQTPATAPKPTVSTVYKAIKSQQNMSR